ncbi:RNA-binding protein 39-like protein [Drosera capensis]
MPWTRLTIDFLRLPIICTDRIGPYPHLVGQTLFETSVLNSRVPEFRRVDAEFDPAVGFRSSSLRHHSSQCFLAVYRTSWEFLMDFDEYDYLEKTVENPEPHKSKDTTNGGDEYEKAGERGQSRKSRRKSQVDDEDNELKDRKPGDDCRNDRISSQRSSRIRDGDRSEKDYVHHRSGRDHRGKEGERETLKGRERDRIRDGERNRDHRREGDKDRDKDKSHDREKREIGLERGKEMDKEKERDHRSRSHSVKHQDVTVKSHDKDLQVIEKEKELREQDRDGRRHKQKKEQANEPAPDPERDQRTVFAYQIALRADERDVFEFFSRAGKVRDVQLIMDRNSRRSKGVGYIEFYDAMSVPMAIALSGQPLHGHPVMVKPSEAEKNLVQSTATSGAGGLAGSNSGGGRRLYVGNLHYNIMEDQLRQVFEPFGTLELVQLPLDETGHCKGFGFVQFSRLEDAKAAQNLNGQVEIAGRTIKVSIVTDQTANQEAGGNTGDFDDDEGGGLALNAHARAALMQKLDRTGTASSIAGSLVTPGSVLATPTASILGPATSMVAPLMQASTPAVGGWPVSGLSVPAANIPTVEPIGVPSECLLLKNMFDPNVESEQDFDLDIKEDVQDECAKYGGLKHIFVDKFPRTTRLNSQTADRIRGIWCTPSSQLL